MEDRDIIAMAMNDTDAVVQVFFVREGKLIGRDHFGIRIGAEKDSSQILTSFVKQFYAGTPFLPKELWIQEGNGVIWRSLSSGLVPEKARRSALSCRKRAEGAAGGTGPEERVHGIAGRIWSATRGMRCAPSVP